MGINIDQITRTKTTIDGDERMVGRDALGDFKMTVDDLLQSLAGQDAPGKMLEYVKNGDPAVNGDRVILQQGQTVPIADYQNAFDAVYKDQTTPAFFKCDSDGTPNAAGLYFIMQDRRALVIKGAGNQTINTRVKSGPAFGAVEEDRMQLLTGDGPTGGGYLNTRKANGTGIVMNGVFSATSTTNDSGSGSATGTLGMTLDFDSSRSPGARTGATTRENSIGTIWGLTY